MQGTWLENAILWPQVTSSVALPPKQQAFTKPHTLWSWAAPTHSQSLFVKSRGSAPQFSAFPSSIFYWHSSEWLVLIGLPSSQECVLDLAPLGGRSLFQAFASSQLFPVQKPFQEEQALKGDFLHFSLSCFKKPTGTTRQGRSSHREISTGVGDAGRLTCTRTRGEHW